MSSHMILITILFSSIISSCPNWAVESPGYLLGYLTGKWQNQDSNSDLTFHHAFFHYKCELSQSVDDAWKKDSWDRSWHFGIISHGDSGPGKGSRELSALLEAVVQEKIVSSQLAKPALVFQNMKCMKITQPQTILKFNNWVVCRTFMMLCYLLPNTYITPRGDLVPITAFPLSPFLHPLPTTHLFSVFMDLPSLNMSYKWNGCG